MAVGRRQVYETVIAPTIALWQEDEKQFLSRRSPNPSSSHFTASYRLLKKIFSGFTCLLPTAI